MSQPLTRPELEKLKQDMTLKVISKIKPISDSCTPQEKDKILAVLEAVFEGLETMTADYYIVHRTAPTYRMVPTPPPKPSAWDRFLDLFSM